MPELLILCGLPGSGKSTRRREWLAEDPDGRVCVNYDDLRAGMFGPDWVFNRKEENQMKAHADSIAKRALGAGLSVVVDNTNLTQKVRARWEQLGKSLGATIVQEELDTPVAECVRRDALRVGNLRVGRAVIERMALFNGFIDWEDESLYHKSASGKDFVIVDVDGTLADCEHRRHHINPVMFIHKMDCTAPVDPPKGQPCSQCGVKFRKDWFSFFSECDKDPAIGPIFKLVEILANSYYIIVVSGRPVDPCGKPTEDWLLKFGLNPLHLFMRGGGDSRSDVEAKGEIADMLPLGRIAYVIDDRPRVLRDVWQTRGLTTLAVGDLKEF